METREEKQMREKLRAVTDLPAGYGPNLESKWELLQAGLVPAKRKRFAWFISIGSAAALLLVASLLLLMNRNKEVEQQVSILVVPPPVQSTPEAVKEKQKIVQAIPVHKPHRALKHIEKKHVADELRQESLPVVDSSTLLPAAVLQEEMPAVELAEKPPRFTELDFNDPVISNHTPSEAVMASQRFKFRIGFSAQSHAGVSDTHKKPALFRKRFN